MNRFAWYVAVCSSIAVATYARAADRVELEILTGDGAPITAAQEWAKMLGELNVGSVQIRGARPGDKTDIQIHEGKQGRTYHVIGLLTSSSELQVPGRKFRISDGARIAEWLTKLAEQGPTAPGEAETPFGLPRKDFTALRRTMAQPVAESTSAAKPLEVAEQINAQLGGLCQISRGARAQLAAAKPSGDELQGMAAGTAMAAILRNQGLGMVPRRKPAGGVACAVVEMTPDSAVWPVGLSAEDRRKELLPILFEFVPVEIDNYSVSEVLGVIAPKLNVPIVLDRLALAVQEIDPAAITVSIPAKRTSYSAFLQKMLMQARLKYELRIDDAGQPFIWITTIKKI